MPTTALATDEAKGRPLASPLRRYQLTTTGSTEVLMRVIGLVRSRCGEIVALDFDRGDRHRPPVLEISVAIDGRRGGALALRLAALIEVTGVREH